MPQFLILLKVKKPLGTKGLGKIKYRKPRCCDSDYVVYKQIYTSQASPLAISNGNNREDATVCLLLWAWWNLKNNRGLG